MLSPVALAVVVVLAGVVLRSMMHTPVVQGPGVKVLPGARPVLGHMRLDFPAKRNVGAFFHDQFRKHSLRSAIVYLAWMPRYVVEDPDLIKHILVTKAGRYRKPIILFTAYREARSAIGDGLLVADGMLWKEHRRVLNPAFSLQHLRGLVPMFAEQTEILLQNFAEYSKEDRAVPLQGEITRCVVEIIGLAAFGASFNAMDNTKASEMPRHLLTVLTQIQNFSLQPWRRLNPFNTHALNTSVAALRKLAQDAIDAKRAQGLQDDDVTILAYLLRSIDNDGGSEYRYNDETIIDEAMTLLFAGHETTATALVWFLTMLHRHPDIKKRVVAEIDAVFADGVPFTYDTLAKVPYLDAVLKETLRLYPPFVGVQRVAIKDDMYGDLLIPAGALIYLNFWGANRSTEVFGPDADEFRPERWLGDSNVDEGARILSFSQGPRNCIGMTFSILEAKTVIMLMLRSFDYDIINDRPGARLPFMQTLTVRPENPMAKFIPRTPQAH